MPWVGRNSVLPEVCSNEMEEAGSVSKEPFLPHDTKEMEATAFSKVRLLLWKNWTIRRRHYLLTACELLIPLILFAFLAYARTKISGLGKVEIPEPSYTSPYSSDLFYSQRFTSYEAKVLFAPNNEFTTNLMQEVQLQLQITNDVIIPFKNDVQLLEYYQNQGGNESIFAILFHNLNGNDVPKRLQYDIRPYSKHLAANWDTDLLYDHISPYIPEQGSSHYINRGFIALQMALDSSFIKLVSQNPLPVTIFMQEFPYPPYVNDLGVSDFFHTILPLVTIFSFLFLCPAVLQRVVEEKYTGIKELMKIMGLKSWMLWLTWFLDAFLLNCLSIGVIVFLMKMKFGSSEYSVIEHCDWSVYLVFLLLYSAAAITFCFLLASFFHKPTVALIFGIITWILTYFTPKSFLVTKWWKKYLLLIFPNMALDKGYFVISTYESKGVDLNWFNLSVPPGGGANEISLRGVFLALIIDSIIFLIVTFYVENVNPGPYGLPKKFTYPMSALWKCFRRNGPKINSTANDLAVVENAEDLEKGIEIRDLHKSFGLKNAVDGLGLTIYEGEITALLGHNGAGKTTTLSILTGMIQATSGDVEIYGYNIEKHMDKIRNLLALCPQHNLLFPDLTVKEHLLFFAMLKGVPQPQAERNAQTWMEKLKIIKKKDTLPCTLSGGMQRKLALGIAFMGNSKVLVLDEPTSGMDLEARREVWDIIHSYRGKRTIIVTTHFMEEAEEIGDRIAIMDHGKLVCYGTPMFLKNEYGFGYYLTIVRKNDRHDSQIKAIVDQHISNTSVEISNANDLMFKIPCDQKPLISNVLHELNEKRENLGISHIDLKSSTLEDVFLQTSSLKQTTKQKDVGEIASSATSMDDSRISGSLWRKAKILCVKRFQGMVKMKKILFLHILTPLAIMALTLFMCSPKTHIFELNAKLPLQLNMYGATDVYYAQTGSNSQLESIKGLYKDTITKTSSTATEVASVSEALINKGIDNIEYYKERLVVAAEFNVTEDGSVVNAMYSNPALHGAPIALNLVTNAILKSLAGKEYAIDVNNHPLPPPAFLKLQHKKSAVETGFIWMFLFPLGLLFFTGSFLLFPLMEQASHMKQLQIMCGVSSFLYWMVSFVVDGALYIAVSAGIVLIYLICGTGGTCALFVLLLLHGICVIPFVYHFAYCKKSSAKAFTFYFMLSLVLGIIATMILLGMEMSGDEWYEKLSTILLPFAFLFFPQIQITYASYKFSQKSVQIFNWDINSPEERQMICMSQPNPCCFGKSDSAECNEYLSFYGKDNPIDCLLILTACAGCLLYFLLLVGRDEYRFLIRLFTRALKNAKQEIKPPNVEGNMYTVNSLEKRFNNNPVVSDLQFKVKLGECFGLLGVNGAGKTTTFRILTCDETKDKGNVHLAIEEDDIDLESQQRKYLEQLGYCPQYDALLDILSGKEILTLFAYLRLIKEEKIPHEVNCWLNILGLEEYKDTPCGEYSGGNKRKLNVGIALIGCPPVILLDEPTNGVDPISRRKLWAALNKMKHIQRGIKPAIILASHSMEECEALCDRLSIMKNGKIECSGTIPNLKKEHAKGFSLLIKLKPKRQYHTLPKVEDVHERPKFHTLQPERKSYDEVDGPVRPQQEQEPSKEDPVATLQRRISTKYKCQLKDQHPTLLHYHVTKKNEQSDEEGSISSLVDLFDEIKHLKDEKDSIIEDYIIKSASLEDVFLNVAKMDDDGDDENAENERKPVKKHRSFLGYGVA